jgi:HlyD family secretion protein
MKKIKPKTIIALGITVVIMAVTAIALLGMRTEQLIRTGQIEMREADIASKIPGRVEWIRVDEGDTVVMGQEVFKLTDREVRAKTGQAQGALDAAEAQWRMTRNGSRPEQKEMAERNYAVANSQYELAERTRARMKGLYSDSLISEQDFDVVEQKFQAALAAMEAARAQRDMASKGTRSEEQAMASGQLERAKQSYEEALAYFDESFVKSPVSGIVTKRLADAGELVSAGYPVLTVLDPNDCWAELNLPATELQYIQAGKIMNGLVHGTGKVTRFKVMGISAMPEFANWRAQNDRGTFEVRSFTVKLRPLDKSEALRPGMTVSFDLKN